jgi:hypothetical protein
MESLILITTVSDCRTPHVADALRGLSVLVQRMCGVNASNNTGMRLAMALLERDTGQCYPMSALSAPLSWSANTFIRTTQVIYTTACCAGKASGDGSFVPLTVNYQERFSAAGKTR